MFVGMIYFTQYSYEISVCVCDADYFYTEKWFAQAQQSKFNIANFRAKSNLKQIADYLSQEVDLTGKRKHFQI